MVKIIQSQSEHETNKTFSFKMSSIKDNNAKGVIRIINQKCDRSKFKEVIYIGLMFKSNKSTFEVEDWQTEIKKHDPIESNFENFAINKREWLSSAKIFVIPTLTFGHTKIEIFLNEHALFGTGFIVEIFNRKNTVRTKFENSDTITTSLGGTITMKIEWQIIKNELLPQITFNSCE